MIKNKTRVCYLGAKLALVVLAGLIAVLLSGPGFTNKEPISDYQVDDITDITASTSHAPILLDGNSALTSSPVNSGETGTSWGDAVVIKNYEIDGLAGTCIEIRNTNAFLIIKNCTTWHTIGYPTAGIKLINCTNVNVTGCKSYNCYNGIWLNNVNQSAISRNNATTNQNIGIYLQSSHGNMVNGNNASANTAHGIMIDSANQNTAQNNTCKNDHDCGIYVAGSQDTSVWNNTIAYCTNVAIEESTSTRTDISNNSISDSNSIGIYLFCGSVNWIRNNEITSSASVSIRIEFSNYGLAENNTCMNTCTEPFATCLLLTWADHCNISRNHFSINSGNNIPVTIDYATNATLQNNTIQGPGIGIKSSTSTFCHMVGNTLINCGIDIYASMLKEANTYDIKTSNKINGKPIFYLANSTDLSNLHYGNGTVVTNPGQVILANCANSSILALSIANSSSGVFMVFCKNVSVVNCNFASCFNGVNLMDSDHCQVNDSVFSYCKRNDIYLDLSDNNTISGNTFEHVSTDVLYLSYSDGNLIKGNNFTCDYGVQSFYSDYNRIIANTFYIQWGSGITLQYARGTQIRNNNITTTGNSAIAIMYTSLNTTVERNNISTAYSGSGLEVFRSNGACINMNNITACSMGISITWSNNTIVRGNHVFNNYHGINIDRSKGNLVFSNNFSSSLFEHAKSDGPSSKNAWDNGTCGNYWDNYRAKYPSAGNNAGFWTTPYVIDGTAGEVDNHAITGELTPTCDFLVNNSNPITTQSVQFTFTGFAGNAPAIFYWVFGDTFFAGNQNPVHTYTTPGSYNVSLTVTDWDGDIAATTKTTFVIVAANIIPTPMFTKNASNVTVGDTVQFTFTGNPGNAPTQYNWTFGDGSTSTLVNPKHMYTIAGLYQVVLTIRDGNGDQASMVTTITVKAPESPSPPTSPAVPGYGVELVLFAVVLALVGIGFKLKYLRNER